MGAEKRMVKPIRMFFPIERVDDAERIVEGYCFCNEVVRGEGGIRLKRSAMEDAAPSYMEFPAIREMHRSDSAVGTAKLMEFDAKGARIRAKIVDDAAWNKVKEGVYRGFSVGVIPTLMRGKDVTKVEWVENSLVDRPADPDALFNVVRSDKYDMDKEYECAVEEKDKTDSHSDRTDKTDSKKKSGVEEPTVAIQRLTSETVDLKRQVNLLKTELHAKDAETQEIRRTAQKAAKRAAKQIDRLSKQPVATAPVLFPSALRGLERNFNVGDGSGSDGSDATLIDTLKKQYDEIVVAAGKEPQEAKRAGYALDLNIIKGQLGELGVSL